MSKLRILPNIVGRLLKPGKLFSKVKVLSVLDHHVVKIPAVKAFEFEKTEWKFNIPLRFISAGLVTLSSVQDGDEGGEPHEESFGSEQEFETVSESVEDNYVDGRDKSYLVEDDELEKVKVDIIEGDKQNSKWLVVNDIYICHRYQGSESETFWECWGRRKFNCPFKLGTYLDSDGNLKVNFMYKLDCHDCEQTKLGPIMQIFRNSLKSRMKANHKAKFHKIFNEEKKVLVTKYSDSPGILERIVYELKDKRAYRVAAQRAKQKCFPKNPLCHEDMDMKKIGLEKYELGRCSHFNPEIKDKDIILLGTPLTAEAFAKAEFKSGDGTFKICPKQFYQVRYYLC